jgi:hypothetical protein
VSAKQERARVEAESRRVRQLEADRLDPVEETRGPCETHPQWIPERRLAGQPNVPASLCPLCADERRELHLRTGSRLPDDEIASQFNPVLPRGMSRERAHGSLEEYRKRFHADGKVVPGSPEEDAALAQIDHSREEEIERERRKHNRALWPHLGRRERVTRIVYSNEAK